MAGESHFRARVALPGGFFGVYAARVFGLQISPVFFIVAIQCWGCPAAESRLGASPNRATVDAIQQQG